MLIDTLTIAQNLTSAGIPDAHAKAIAKEYAHLMQHQIDQFATKEDITLLRNDLKHVEERLDVKIDTKFHELDNKIDTKFNELDNKVDTKFHALDNKVDTKVDELDNKIDTRFNELDNKIDYKIDQLDRTVGGQISQLDTKIDSMVWRMTVNLWGVAATVVSLLFAALRLFHHT